MVWVDSWSGDDVASLVRKREDEGKPMRIVAAELGRPVRTCNDRYAKVVAARLASAPLVAPGPPRRRPQSFHKELGIATFVHRQAILFDPRNENGRTLGQVNAHWFRYDVTLPKVFA